MKKIKTILEKQTKLYQQPKESEPISKETVSKIWLFMAEMFGHRWTSSYGDEIDPNGVWRAALKGVSDEKVKEGLNMVAKSGKEWPPSAPEFRKLCLYGDNQEQSAFDAMAKRQDEERLALPKLKARKETARKHLDEMRGKL